MARRKVAIDAGRAAFFPSDVIDLKIKKLCHLMYYAPVDITNWQIRQSHYVGPGEYEFLDADFRPFNVGDTWGGDDDVTAFLKCETTVPASYDNEPLYLEMYINGYSLLKLNGKPLHGLDYYRQRNPVTVKFAKPIKSAAHCNLIEQSDDEPATVDKASLKFNILPFELQTFKLKF